MGIHLFWSTPPPPLTDVRLLLGESPRGSTCQLCHRGYESRSNFPPLSKSIIVLTLDFNPSEILVRVGPILPTMGQSGILPRVWSIPLTPSQSVILLGVRFVPLTTG